MIQGRCLALFAIGASLLFPARSYAQRCSDSARIATFVVLGGIAEEHVKREELSGCRRTRLIRSPGSLSAELPRSDGWRPSYEVVLPQISLTWNSSLPHSTNDGAQWAGRGASGTMLIGIRFRLWRVAGNIVPEFLGNSNGLFNFRPAQFPGRSPYGSWLNTNLPSIDQPTRFGYRPFAAAVPGQSSVELRVRQVAAGISTENMWWGPGVRTAIVMSNNAGGIPHAYFRSPSPWRTPIGSFEGRVVLGFLTESPYFDTEVRNDQRSFSAAVLTVTPVVDPNLTVGATRVSYGEIRHLTALPRHAFDFALALPAAHRDEIQSLFARWGFPASGFEVHAEWSRLRLPSLRELMVNPERTQGYTVGLQWMDVTNDWVRFRVQGEVTMLEQARPPDGGRPLGYYASSRVAQGYTQRGQVIGAATGPGSSSQWLGVEATTDRWTAGAEIERVRWNDDAYYSEAPTGFLWFAHDVSLLGGISASRAFERLNLRASILRADRLNHQNQSANSGYSWSRAFDVTNYTLNMAAAYRR